MSEQMYYPLAARLHITRNGEKEIHLVGVVPVDKDGKLLFSTIPGTAGAGDRYLFGQPIF